MDYSTLSQLAKSHYSSREANKPATERRRKNRGNKRCQKTNRRETDSTNMFTTTHLEDGHVGGLLEMIATFLADPVFL